MTSPDPTPAEGSPSLLPDRKWLRLRRRSDKVWFAVSLFCLVSWVSIFTYKLRFEPPDMLPADEEPVGEAPGREPAPPPSAFDEPSAAVPADQEPEPEPEPDPDQEEPAPEPAAEPAPRPRPAKAERKEKPERKKPAKKEAPKPAPKAAKPEPKPATPKGVLVDSGERATPWTPAQAQGASLRLGSEAGALVMTYDMPGGKWVAMRRGGVPAVSPASVFVLRVRGEGASNDLEFKLTDRDGSNYGKTFPGATGGAAWRELRISAADLRHLWGGDKALDWSGIRYIDIAISGPGGKGKFFIDEIRLQ